MQQHEIELREISKRYEPELKTHFLNVEKVLQRLVRNGASPEEVAKRASEMYDSAEGKARAKAAYKPDCKSGCAYCCCVVVEVSSQEVALLARELRSKLCAEEITVLRDQMKAVIAGRAEGKRPRCALLGDDELCTVYEFRPIGCRMCNSPDAEGCKTYEIDGLETPRKEFALSPLLAMGTQMAAYMSLNPDAKPYSMPSKLELMSELLKALVDT